MLIIMLSQGRRRIYKGLLISCFRMEAKLEVLGKKRK